MAAGVMRSEDVDHLVSQLRSKWASGYFTAKRRGLIGRKVPKENSLYAYATWIREGETLGLPDLATCTLDELTAFLDVWKRTHGEHANFNLVGVIKEALKYLKRQDLNENIRRPSRPDPRKSVNDKIVADDDVKRLIEGAGNLRDRLLVEMFDELGSRRGEMWRLKIKDVQFDSYGAILTLDGKTGVRRRRVYNSIPDLRAWLNEHPDRKNPFAPLFLTSAGKPFSSPKGMYDVIRKLSKRILGRPVHPHQFRHARATHDSSLFTDREMMKLYGWNRPDMVAVYSHLSMKDVEDKDLILHGLKSREEVLRPITQIQKCTACQESNAPIAVYCCKCGELLPNARPEELKKLQEKNRELETRLDNLTDNIMARVETAIHGATAEITSEFLERAKKQNQS
jgi:integrase